MVSEKEARLEILSLRYSRLVSRAHTIFSSFWEIVGGSIVGTIGLVFTLVQMRILPEFNKYYLFILLIVYFVAISVIGLLAWYYWFESTQERKKILNEIELLPKAT